MAFFGLKYGQDLENQGSHPLQSMQILTRGFLQTVRFL